MDIIFVISVKNLSIISSWRQWQSDSTNWQQTAFLSLWIHSCPINYSHSIKQSFLALETNWYDYFLSIEQFRNKLAENRSRNFVLSQLIIFDNSTPVFHIFHLSLWHQFFSHLNTTLVQEIPHLNKSNFTFYLKNCITIKKSCIIIVHNERFWRSI